MANIEGASIRYMSTCVYHSDDDDDDDDVWFSVKSLGFMVSSTFHYLIRFFVQKGHKKSLRPAGARRFFCLN